MTISKEKLKENIKIALRRQYGKSIEEAKSYEIYYAVSRALMEDVSKWYNTKKTQAQKN